MTIKEIEELAGMPRANIRYYEKEGLLNPERDVNGYREYSEKDLLILKKIKLLRSLHMSIEEIKALHTGKQELSVILEQQIQKLAADKVDLDKAHSVCEIMYKDGIKYESLDAEKYLKNLNEGIPVINARNYGDTKESREDMFPRVQAPWRRFFARTLDVAFYSVIWSCFLILVFQVNIANQGSSGWAIVETIVILLLTLVFEPLQLTLFGTTLGKWILGLRVLHNDDRKLSFSEAYERTKQVLKYGIGFQIPILSWILLWKSYNMCTVGKELEWETDSRLLLKDEKKIRIPAYILAQAMLIVVLVFANVLVQIPKYRGELTVAEFCENYRRLEKYYGITSTHTLDDRGIWVDTEPDDGTVVYDSFPCEAPPSFNFETDSNGKIIKISFVVEEYISQGMPKEERQAVSSNQLQMQLAALAFVGAKNEFSQFSSARKEMVEIIASHEFEDYNFSEAGVRISCDVEWQGYEVLPGYNQNGNTILISLDEGESSFYMEFTMSNQ